MSWAINCAQEGDEQIWWSEQGVELAPSACTARVPSRRPLCRGHPGVDSSWDLVPQGVSMGQGSPGVQFQEGRVPEKGRRAKRGQTRGTALCQVQRTARKSQAQGGLTALQRPPAREESPLNRVHEHSLAHRPHPAKGSAPTHSDLPYPGFHTKGVSTCLSSQQRPPAGTGMRWSRPLPGPLQSLIVCVTQASS